MGVSRIMHLQCLYKEYYPDGSNPHSMASVRSWVSQGFGVARHAGGGCSRPMARGSCVVTPEILARPAGVGSLMLFPQSEQRLWHISASMVFVEAEDGVGIALNTPEGWGKETKGWNNPTSIGLGCCRPSTLP